MGAIVRDSTGRVMAALSKKFTATFSTNKDMEAEALCHSLHWAKNLDLPIQVVESDALTIHQTFIGHFIVKNLTDGAESCHPQDKLRKTHQRSH
ncbi:Ribonuclease H-like domain containing protein [Parasponia andersonii]|uniref:Ribonuclease H-like domain containing protein n=1 Tax=Parasponia andersonii TaxID=3476 RepID=A0A2P5AQM3_PARAD|nr:Ribonuclease H-like domain containing protein [Parasponia andersonii]